MKNFPQNLSDSNEYRGMVRWFSPTVLLKTAKKAVDSKLFGQYADRRLVHAALDSPIDAEKLFVERCGGAEGICGKDNKNEIWVDYVADLGDGFDSTYAIAYLIGQKSVNVGGDFSLPRAECLVMGGDQVYPDASREEYKKRMLRPYRAAFPRSRKPGSSHPRLLLIPGNHDWYDGLTLFLALFCKGREIEIGSWVTNQHRSYFAVHLGMNWWVWGVDSQLGEDIDKPQADYFVSVAKQMSPESKVIICASVPTWLKADLAGDKVGQEEYYRALHYVASIVSNECPSAQVPLVLSGDLHHYSRYVGATSGSNFITAGGGGAFLHPTHHLKGAIPVKWPFAESNEESLEIGNVKESDGLQKAIYPSKTISRKLASGNFLFPLKNPEFCLVLGLLYWVCAFLMLASNGYGEGGFVSFSEGFKGQTGRIISTPVFVLVSVALLAILYGTAEIASRKRRWIVAVLHTLIHIAIVVVGAALVSTLIADIYTVVLGDILYFFALAIGMLAVGFLGGAVWGVYLTFVSFFWGDHSNGAFSAMRLDSYRHFLRLKIERDKLTIYPIGIDESPKRKDWKMNEEYIDGDPDQDTPAIVPKKVLGQHLIEEPIVIEV